MSSTLRTWQRAKVQHIVKANKRAQRQNKIARPSYPIEVKAIHKPVPQTQQFWLMVVIARFIKWLKELAQ